MSEVFFVLCLFFGLMSSFLEVRMPDFEGSRAIIIQPTDVMVPYSFNFTVCTSSTGNDGALPFGHTINSMAVAAHHENGTVMSTAIIGASVHSSFTTLVSFSYPSSTGIVLGKYHLTFTATVSDGTTTYTREFDFNRVMVKNK